MGMDINFNKELADAAGIEYTTIRNGSDEDILKASTSEDTRDGYLTWLQEELLCIKVPVTGTYVNIGVFDGMITLRANKWGHVYKPLTQWLKENDIRWNEFQRVFNLTFGE